MKEDTLVRFPLTSEISLKCEASESVQYSTCYGSDPSILEDESEKFVFLKK